MTTNFSHLLSRPVESAKRPPTKPAGTYYGNVHSYKFAESPKEKTPYVRFVFNNLQPGPDITSDQMKDAEGNDIDLSKWTPHVDFYLTDAALYRLREFLEDIGVQFSGRQFDEVIPETKGLPVMLTTVQAPSNKPGSTDIYTNISEVKGVK